MNGVIPEAVLGRSGRRSTRFGLGLAALGRPAYINVGHGADVADDRSVEGLRARTHSVLDAAYAEGVRYYDAARSYGLAEDFLGEWLRDRQLSPGSVTVGSKWGYRYTGGWRLDADAHEVKDLSAATLRRQLEETRERLGEHLDLYQIHSATVESGVLEDREVLALLSSLREEGVAVGLSVTGPQQAETIERAMQTGAFDTVQATWNLLERSAAAALERAHDEGMGVIVKEAVANGRLTGRAASPELLSAAAEAGAAPDALAIAAALAQPWADVVLSGASSVAMLESNLAALRVRLDGELLERLGVMAELPEAYWSTRSQLPWT
jgi:aryl-alcohol dehydrogenase-like predicted oxidoreductase